MQYDLFQFLWTVFHLIWKLTQVIQVSTPQEGIFNLKQKVISIDCGSGIELHQPHACNKSYYFLKTFSGLQGSWSVCCLHLKMEFCSCARGREWCGIIHYYWWTASIKPRLLFSRAGYASWGLFLHQFKVSLQ